MLRGIKSIKILQKSLESDIENYDMEPVKCEYVASGRQLQANKYFIMYERWKRMALKYRQQSRLTMAAHSPTQNLKQTSASQSRLALGQENMPV